MAVFTLPAFNLVFKIIKDQLRRAQEHDPPGGDGEVPLRVRARPGGTAGRRAGVRAPGVPAPLLSRRPAGVSAVASPARTVRVEGDRVIVRHVYTERRVTPLNLFLRDAEPAAAREAVIDYGNAIKDLAAADIFTGDMLLKNFGVTRNGRVICYDYDELCLLSDCRFRRIPPPHLDRGRVRGRAVVLRGGAGRVPRGVPRLPGAAGRRCATRFSRPTATCWRWSSGSGCSAGWARARWWTSFPTGGARLLRRS